LRHPQATLVVTMSNMAGSSAERSSVRSTRPGTLQFEQTPTEYRSASASTASTAPSRVRTGVSKAARTAAAASSTTSRSEATIRLASAAATWWWSGRSTPAP
jgi:hypothetical protein